MKYVKPVRIIDCSKNITNIENFFLDFPDQIELIAHKLMHFSGDGYVILDFGKEYSGGIKIFSMYIAKNSSIRIRFGESVGETCSDIGYKGATNDHSPRDFVVKLPLLCGLNFGETGFRFVRIDFKGEFWDLRNIVASVTNDEREEIGTFKCDDEVINQIWDTAAYTLRLNLHNGLLWDGVKRDRLCWIGDAYPETKAMYCLFKDTKEVENSLEFTANTTNPDEWCNGIAMYDCWFMLILHEKFMFDGDKKTPEKYADFLLNSLNKINSLIDEDGTTHFPMNFIDWPGHYNGGDGEELIKKDDETSGVSYLLKLTAQRMIELFTLVNNDKIIEVSKEIIRKTNNLSLKVTKFKQMAALGVMCGEDQDKLEVLMKNGAHGLSTFQSYFILSGLAHYGKYDEAFAYFKEYYGGMLSVGSTTFWEDFDLEWLENCSKLDELPVDGKKDIHGDYGKFCYVGYRHSLCHGWSSGVIPYIVENVVGLKRIDSTHFVFKPHLSTLKNVECTVPTIKGLIQIKISKKGDKINTNLIIPEGISVNE